MQNKVLSAINRFSMFSKGDSVTVALSGGADSMALLHLLYSNRGALGISLSAAHLNHMLRGAESDRDEAFVRQYCEALDIPLICERIDVAAYSKQSGKSVEQAARDVRYDFFERVSQGKTATAHTASDNAETLLINLLRGTALKGACGIPPVRGQFVRPLIFCTRAEIEAYCAENEIPFVTDSTNLTDDYTRNKIRHNIIPAMREINPSLEAAITRFTLSAGEDSAFLEKLAADELEKSKKGDALQVGCVAPPIAKRIIGSFLEEQLGTTADNLHINEVYDALGSKTKRSISGGQYAFVDGRRISVGVEKAPKTYDVSMQTASRKEIDLLLKVNKLLLKNAIDCDKIIGKVYLRTREEGDSIKLAGRGTKSLKKLYNEMHIPPQDRELLPVAADERGVVWVCGIGVSERARVDDNTCNATIFTVNNANNNFADFGGC